MGATIPDPQYVTLSATGNGSVYIRGQRPNMVRIIRKITIEAPDTGSGTVSIYFRSQLVSSKPIALLMTAEGEMELHAGEEVEVRFVAGRASAEVKVTSHYEEVKL